MENKVLLQASEVVICGLQYIQIPLPVLRMYRIYRGILPELVWKQVYEAGIRLNPVVFPGRSNPVIFGKHSATLLNI